MWYKKKYSLTIVSSWLYNSFIINYSGDYIDSVDLIGGGLSHILLKSPRAR